MIQKKIEKNYDLEKKRERDNGRHFLVRIEEKKYKKKQRKVFAILPFSFYFNEAF